MQQRKLSITKVCLGFSDSSPLSLSLSFKEDPNRAQVRYLKSVLTSSTPSPALFRGRVEIRTQASCVLVHHSLHYLLPAKDQLHWVTSTSRTLGDPNPLLFVGSFCKGHDFAHLPCTSSSWSSLASPHWVEGGGREKSKVFQQFLLQKL